MTQIVLFFFVHQTVFHIVRTTRKRAVIYLTAFAKTHNDGKIITQIYIHYTFRPVRPNVPSRIDPVPALPCFFLSWAVRIHVQMGNCLHWQPAIVYQLVYNYNMYVIWKAWLGSRVVSVLDSCAEGPGFKSQSRRCRVTVLGKLFTPIVPLFTKQQNWQQPS